MSLLDCQAKICLTAAGVLIHNQQVLLVKHKKLKMWLNPGGHLEIDEAPHQAAEREFWEETGLKTKAKFVGPQPVHPEDVTEYQPCPFLTNLHWVCEDNYQKRQADPVNYQPVAPWKRGCEQHLNLVYLMDVVGDDIFKLDDTETDDIRWFTKEQVQAADIKSNILYEITVAFDLAAALKK